MVIKVLFLVIHLLFYNYVKSEEKMTPYALSSTYLMHLARAESQIYREMIYYAKDVKERLRLIKTYLHDYKDSTLKLDLNPKYDLWGKAEQVASNPITAYRMVRRFAQDFRTVEDHLMRKLESKLEQKTRQILHNIELPTMNEVYDAIEAILRIHYVYDLKLEEFARGNIMGVKTPVGLSSSQTFQIAKHASFRNYYSLAMNWLQATESKIKAENKTSFPFFELANVYKKTIEKHDKDFEENFKLKQLYIFSEKLSQNLQAPTIRQVNFEKYGHFYDPDNPDLNYYSYLALCNGQNLQSEKYKASLSCWFDKRHPYFYLFPLKAELLNHEPLLIQFHQVISEEWAKEFKEVAIPHLKRVKMSKPTDTERTGTYAYFKDEDIQADMSRRIELITGLNVKGDASENLQIASSVLGAHVELHVDTYGQAKIDKDPTLKRIQPKGDRISTFLVYLNDIERGGFTGFPELGIYVKPEKGSALFWYTSMKNGESDTRLGHGACPAVLGHKWVATKCTNLNKNFLTRPCDLRNDV